MKKIIENATITYKNRAKQIFDAILITDKGIFIGKIRSQNRINKEFEDHGFIPRGQIEKITVCTEQGKVKDIDF